jgi:hypothetical protein
MFRLEYLGYGMTIRSFRQNRASRLFDSTAGNNGSGRVIATRIGADRAYRTDSDPDLWRIDRWDVESAAS